MANGFFAVYRNHLWTPQAGFSAVDLVANTVRGFFVDYADDTPNLATDQDIADIASPGRIPAWSAPPTALAGKTVGVVGTGVFDANDTTLLTVSGDQAEALVLAVDAGTEATSILLHLWDTGVTNLPVSFSGGNVVLAWNSGGIFSG